jgi:hypothetical protein
VHPIALLAHGAGSSPGTVLRLLAAAVPPGVRPVAVDARGSVDDVVRRLHAAAVGSDVVLAAGISLGAHAVAAWALDGGRCEALLIVMPAWTGEPDGIAGLTSSTAVAVETRGRGAVLAEIMASAPDDWVVRELADGWATYTDDELAATLRAAAGSPAPSLDDLARLEPAVAVVALADDPLHPEAVARDWAAATNRSALETVARQAPAQDVNALGLAGRDALLRLRVALGDRPLLGEAPNGSR